MSSHVAAFIQPASLLRSYTDEESCQSTSQECCAMPDLSWWERREAERHLRAYRTTQRRELTPYESEGFIPLIVGQLEFIGECFRDVMAKAQDPQTAHEIAHVLASLLPDPPPPARPRDPDEDARQYLAGVATQCQREFLDPLAALLTSRPPNPNVPNPDVLSLATWFSGVQKFCSSITRNRTILFWMKLRSFTTQRDPRTGGIVVGLPPQIDAIAFPFDAILDEAARVAGAIQENIDGWRKEVRETGARLLEASTARKQAFASMLLLIFQVFVTVLALTGVFLGFMFPDWISGRKDAAAARTELQEARTKLEDTRHELDRALREKDRVSRERDDAQNESKQLRMQLQEALKPRK